MNAVVSGFAKRRSIEVGLASLVLVAVTGAAEAQVVRFIKTTGNDANECTFTAPCRTLARGIVATPPRGELRVLDSGGFGNGTSVGKSLTVSGQGNTVLLAGPLTISKPGLRVVLENILFNGRGATVNGVVANNAVSLHVSGCTFERFAETGLVVDQGAEVSVTDSIFRSNGDRGMAAFGSRVSIADSHFDNNAFSGLRVVGLGTVSGSTFSNNGDDGISVGDGQTTVTRSTASGNSRAGFAVFSGRMLLDSSVAHGNTEFGILVNSGAGAVIADMTVTGNAVGIQNNGTIQSRENSTVTGNTNNVEGTVQFGAAAGI